MKTMNAAFHVITTAMVGAATGFCPGSIFLMFLISLMAAAYGLGDRGSIKEGEERELPTLLVAYLAAGWLGALLNTAALILLVRK